jgi:hypothetical protein
MLETPRGESFYLELAGNALKLQCPIFFDFKNSNVVGIFAKDYVDHLMPCNNHFFRDLFLPHLDPRENLCVECPIQLPKGALTSSSI